MDKYEKSNQVADDIRTAYRKRELAHATFMKTGLYQDKLKYDGLCADFKALALQYVVLSLGLDS